MLTLVMGLAVARALNGLQVKAGIKWPNDVVLSGKKVCGILCEYAEGAVVCGIGINLKGCGVTELLKALVDQVMEPCEV